MFVVNVLTLLAVVWYACEARKQRIAMDNTFDEVKKQTTTAHDSLVLGNRPWVHEKIFHIAKPLEFTVNGEASIIISGTLENLGHSPALQARSNSFLIAITMTKFVNEEIAEKQDALCNPLRTQSRQLLDTAIFPGDLIPVQEGIGLSQKDIQAAAKARSSGPFRREGYISLAVITCVDYQMSFLSEHHQTRYAFQLGIPKGGGFMGDVKPEGVQPDVQLIYFSESAD
jgi:hypothetical protein